VLYLGAECELLLRFADITYTHVVSRSSLADLGSTLDLYLPPRQLRVWPERRTASRPSPAATEPVPGAVTSPVVAAG
jgi:hypothetical protein